MKRWLLVRTWGPQAEDGPVRRRARGVRLEVVQSAQREWPQTVTRSRTKTACVCEREILPRERESRKA